MKKGVSRPKIGDVYEIPLTDGVGYLQYAKREPDVGFLVRILQGIYPTTIPNALEIAEKEEQFTNLYYLPGALNDGLIRLVGNTMIPRTFTCPNLYKNNPLSAKWLIWDRKQSQVEDPLRVEHFDLPMREIIGHEILVSRIESGWHPHDEVFLLNPELRQVYDDWKRSNETS